MRRIDVAVLVVEVGAGDAGRQIALDVADLLADLVPELLHLGGRRLVDQEDLDEGDARLRIAFDAVEIGQLLQLLLDLVGDLGLHLGRGGAGPADVHDHGLDGEGGILGAAEAEVGIGAGGAEHQDHEQHQRLMRDRPFREIEPLHAAPSRCSSGDCSSPRRLVDQRVSTVRTCVPATSFCTPSVTTRSPSATPALTSAAFSVKDATVTGRSSSAPGGVDQIDRRAGAAVEDGGERQLGHLGAWRRATASPSRSCRARRVSSGFSMVKRAA